MLAVRASQRASSSSSRSTTTRATSARAAVPILVFDAWEHAFYLQYKNQKVDFIEAMWRVVNWQDVAKRYVAAKVAHGRPAAGAVTAELRQVDASCLVIVFSPFTAAGGMYGEALART
ncbi:hypothetical protein SCYAM73S_04254 [Streptomyces cyaneofuscatus]